MYNFVILTDNTVDMPVEWLNEHEVGYECLPCSMNGVVYDKKNPIGDNYVDFGIYNTSKEANRNFVNGYERTILLDFNVDGPILDTLDD